MLMLNRHFRMELFCWRFKDSIMCFVSITEVMVQDDTDNLYTMAHFQLLPIS